MSVKTKLSKWGGQEAHLVLGEEANKHHKGWRLESASATELPNFRRGSTNQTTKKVPTLLKFLAERLAYVSERFLLDAPTLLLLCMLLSSLTA